MTIPSDYALPVGLGERLAGRCHLSPLLFPGRRYVWYYLRSKSREAGKGQRERSELENALTTDLRQPAAITPIRYIPE